VKRREFVTLVGAAAAWPLTARAQQEPVPVVGWLSSYFPDGFGLQLLASFRQGLVAAGYFEDRNVRIEYRWAEGQNDRLPALAADLVRRQVAVIAVGGTPDALAAKALTKTIPIVFTVGGDPVQAGLVASLNPPDSNLTGVSLLNVEVIPKRIELLHEVIPTATKLGLLVNPADQIVAESTTRSAEKAARALGLQVHVVQASSERDLDAVFVTLRDIGVGGLTIAPNTFFNSRSERIAELSIHYRMPAVYQYRGFAAAGGLMSYGSSNLADGFRSAGSYVGRILKGEKVSELPVQQITRVELIINLKTAKAFGITMPTALLVRADEVIE
jgi:putative ABC transport system substrate-binding protein